MYMAIYVNNKSITKSTDKPTELAKPRKIWLPS